MRGKEVTPQDEQLIRVKEVVSMLVERKGHRAEFAIALGDITEAEADALVLPIDPGTFTGFERIQKNILQRAGLLISGEEEEQPGSTIILDYSSMFHKGFIDVKVGSAVTTSAGKLENIKAIIHINNLKAHDSPFDPSLKKICIANALREAEKNGLESVATPALVAMNHAIAIAPSIQSTILGMQDYLDTSHAEIKKLTLVLPLDPNLQNEVIIQNLLMGTVLSSIPQLGNTFQA